MYPDSSINPCIKEFWLLNTRMDFYHFKVLMFVLINIIKDWQFIDYYFVNKIKILFYNLVLLFSIFYLFTFAFFGFSECMGFLSLSAPSKKGWTGCLLRNQFSLNLFIFSLPISQKRRKRDKKSERKIERENIYYFFSYFFFSSSNYWAQKADLS